MFLDQPTIRSCVLKINHSNTILMTLQQILSLCTDKPYSLGLLAVFDPLCNFAFFSPLVSIPRLSLVSGKSLTISSLLYHSPFLLSPFSNFLPLCPALRKSPPTAISHCLEVFIPSSSLLRIRPFFILSDYRLQSRASEPPFLQFSSSSLYTLYDILPRPSRLFVSIFPIIMSFSMPHLISLCTNIFSLSLVGRIPFSFTSPLFVLNKTACYHLNISDRGKVNKSPKAVKVLTFFSGGTVAELKLQIDLSIIQTTRYVTLSVNLKAKYSLFE